MFFAALFCVYGENKLAVKFKNIQIVTSRVSSLFIIVISVVNSKSPFSE